MPQKQNIGIFKNFTLLLIHLPISERNAKYGFSNSKDNLCKGYA